MHLTKMKKKNKSINFLHSIKMSEKTLKFGNITVNKKEFHVAKKLNALSLVNIGKKLISDKLKHHEKSSKNSAGYTDDNIFKTLCIILCQMNGYIKYFDDGGKNISFKIEDNGILV